LAAQGRVLFVELVRTGLVRGNMANKVCTPIAEPQPNDQNWQRKELVMVVAHSGTGALLSPSHYFSFFCMNSVWWRVDTGTGQITEENPFITQMSSVDRDGFTINFLVFKQ
jgi:hypothetical protein